MMLLLLTSFIYYHIMGDNVYPINLALQMHTHTPTYNDTQIMYMDYLLI